MLLWGRGIRQIFQIIQDTVREQNLSGFDQIRDNLPELCKQSHYDFVRTVAPLPDHISVEQFLEFAKTKDESAFVSLDAFIMGYSEEKQAMSVAMSLSYPLQDTPAYTVDQVSDPGFFFFMNQAVIMDFIKSELKGPPQTKGQMLRGLRKVFAYEKTQPKPFKDLVLGGGPVQCTTVFPDRIVKENLGPLEAGPLKLVQKRKKIKKTYGKNKK